MLSLEKILKVKNQDPDFRRKGRVLAIILLGMTVAMITLATYNAIQEDSRYYFTNVLLLLLLLAIFCANRFGFVYAASLATVGLVAVGPFLLVDERLTASYLAMSLPVLISSSLFVPWSGFLVAGFLFAGAVLYGIATSALLILLIIAVIAYLFSDSLNRAYRESRYQALHDSLTGLPNRDSLLERLEQVMVHAKGAARPVAVLYIDIDKFKVVNDSLGHELGDRLLVLIGERIKSCVRPADTLAHLGGDEFAVLLEDLPNADAVDDMVKLLAERLRMPFDLDGRQVTINLSMGVAFDNYDHARPVELLRNASVAMYRAKRSATEYKVFQPIMHVQALERLELEEDLREAIENEDFEVYYQTKISFLTGRIAGVESLVRWNSSRRGLIEPSEFIPIAEETGLILPIGNQVLEEACAQLKEWQLDYRVPPELLRTSVNLSVRQFQNPNLVADVSRILQKTGLPAENLQLEVTESVVLEDEEHAIDTLAKLKSLGIQIAIDDFGKGYSSLGYLKILPVDSLKIDGSFVRGMDREAADEAIVRSVIDLSHTLGLEVTAEGVENEHQSLLLKEMGCDLGQGFYFSEPLPSIEVGNRLAKQSLL